MLRGHNGNAAFVAFFSDDQVINASESDEDSTVRLWNLSDGAHPSSKSSLSAPSSPTKRTLGCRRSRGGKVRLVDLHRPVEDVVRSTVRYEASIKSISFSPNSTRLANCAQNGTMLVRSLPEGEGRDSEILNCILLPSSLRW